MKKKWIKSVVLFAVFWLARCFTVYCQVNIAGPTCVVAATEYQYNISANWKDTSLIRICIAGGAIATTSNSCYGGAPVPMVRVIWNDTITGSIQVSSGVGTASLQVTMTHLLSGGLIDSNLRVQKILVRSVPAPITCSAAKGGGCSPIYFYQWQQSPDNLSWADVPGASGKDLTLTRITGSGYYRRKVVEKISNSESYSDGAAILVVQVNNQ